MDKQNHEDKMPFKIKNGYSDTAHAQYKQAQDCVDPSTECGMGSCRPNSLQCCSNIMGFSMFYSFAGLATSTLSMYINSQITTLEKQFGFSSSQTGFLMSCNDIGFLATVLFFSYMTRKVHIPRVLGLCTILFGCSGFICALANTLVTDTQSSEPMLSSFKNMTYTMKFQASQSLCSAVHESDVTTSVPEAGDCEAEIQTSGKVGIPRVYSGVAIAIIAIGMIVQGITKSPRHAYVTTYVDDNVDKTKTALFMGIIMGFGIFGPAIAFTVGGVFSKIYVTLEDVDINPRDPRWIGAWWLGFAVFGAAGVVFGIPLLFFPRRFRPKDKESEALKPDMGGVKQSLKGVLSTFGRLLKNKVYVPMLLAHCISMMNIAGTFAFMPKYLETQFTIPSWQANILLGITTVVAASIGTFVGGVITTKRKLPPIKCITFVILVNLVITALGTLGFVLGCSNPRIAGHSSFTANNTNRTMPPDCSLECNCDNTDYFPVCASNNMTFFSPCHAGCSIQVGQVFHNCSCGGSEDIMTAVPGLCEQPCQMLYPFIAITFFNAFVSTMTIMPGFIFYIRSVSEKDKSFAIGLNAFASSLLGWLPGPVIIGKIVDTSCLVWQTSCSGRGACTMYDLVDFRVKRFAVNLGFNLVVLVLYTFALCKARKKEKSQHVQQNMSIDKPQEKKSLISTNINNYLKTNPNWDTYNICKNLENAKESDV